MIGNMTYEQVEILAKELESSTTIVENITKNLNIEELEDFVSTVEGYYKYLNTIIEMNKDADKALETLKSKK
ncbi:MAG: hypothetical protein PUE33_05125 [bacterium]|nr:hypothetical protein [Mycoplasmatota bacterium]MDD6757427.1 hypothetical protein [bacterium]MDY2907820.1 hypothetical protein [Candidatus Faecimonas sp.]